MSSFFIVEGVVDPDNVYMAIQSTNYTDGEPSAPPEVHIHPNTVFEHPNRVDNTNVEEGKFVLQRGFRIV